MPTFVGHSLVALSASAALHQTPLGKAMPFSGWLALLLIVSLLPDFDILMLRWLPYSHPLSHRGLGHSLFFALVAAFALTIGCRLAGTLQGSLTIAILAWLVIAAVMGSHGLLDAMTDGGLGIALLSPFDQRRIFFPVRPIPVALLSLNSLSSPYMVHVYTVELALFGPFCLAAWLAAADLSGMLFSSPFRWLAAGVLSCVGLAAWIARCRSMWI